MLTLRTVKTMNSTGQRRLWRSLDVGLALTDHAALLIAGHEQAGQYNVVAAGQLTFEQPFSEQPAAAAQATRKWLTEELGYCPSQVVATLPAVAMDYEAVEVPSAAAEPATSIDSQDWSALAAQSLDELLGADADQVAYDYWFSDPTTTPTALAPTLHLVWTAAETASLLGRGLAAAGRQLRTLGTPLSALARCSSWNSPDESVLLVDIEDTTLTLVWCQQGEPRYVRNQIQFTDQTAVEALVARRGLSVNTAAITLTHWGVSPQSDLPPLGEVVTACLHDWLERLCYEIQRTVRYLIGQQPRAASPRVALCGSSATIGGLAPWLSDKLDLPVTTVTPPAVVVWKSAQPYNPSYAVALANALEARRQ